MLHIRKIEKSLKNTATAYCYYLFQLGYDLLHSIMKTSSDGKRWQQQEANENLNMFLFLILGVRCWMANSHSASVGQWQVECRTCISSSWTHPCVTIPVIWLFALTMTLPPLLGWSSFQPESSGMR